MVSPDKEFRYFDDKAVDPPKSEKVWRGQHKETVPAKLRFEVLRRDQFKCVYCGRSAIDEKVKLHVDHLVAESKGGPTALNNLVTACQDCNIGKDNATIKDYRHKEALNNLMGLIKPRFADRVVELRKVPASMINENPNNWRVHPETQMKALEGMLEDIGFADVVIARETPDGLELVDGHLRRDIMGDDPIPVLIVDINEDEAKRMLATLDPIAAMAETNVEILSKLIDGSEFANADITDMLQSLRDEVSIPDILDGLKMPDGSDEKQEAEQMVVVTLRMDAEKWTFLRPQILDLQNEGVLVDVV